MKNFRFQLLLCLFLRTVFVAAQVCPSITKLDPYYVMGEVTCNAQGTVLFNVYEDCPPNVPMFQVDDRYKIIDTACNQIKILEENQFALLINGDAENSQNDDFLCPNVFQSIANETETHSATFQYVDVNEFPPRPVEIGSSKSVDVNENEEGVIFQFSYTDTDKAEISSIKCTFDFGENAGEIFTIKSNGVNEAKDAMMFDLVAMKQLDFEVQSSFYLEAEFSSEDPRGNSSSVLQVFRINVIDEGDNPPYFTSPSDPESIPEGEQDVLVFRVQARDGDSGINNTIMYSIVGGNEEEYFKIDDVTGEVFTAKEIDRESLESTTFNLLIQAQEVFKNGTNAPDDSSFSVTKNVRITDINDNVPSFSNDSVSVTIDEFDDNSPSTTFELDVDITVSDLDENESGEYSLTTNNENVLLDPSSGNGETSIRIVLKKSQNFDYEFQADNPIINVEITATEIADSSHISKLMLTINLLDINDNIPTFDAESYDVEALETITAGTSIVVFTAVDNDASDEFNSDSVIYTISGCNEFTIDDITGNVTLTGSPFLLDYEQQTSIDCTVTATDMNGDSEDSLRSQVSLTVSVIDVNDEEPVFLNFVNSLNISEGIEPSTVVIPIEVEDVDTTADLQVIILSSELDKEDIDSWFELVKNENESTADHFIGTINVKTSPDHEVAPQVSLIIQATDAATEVGNKFVSRTLLITIDDINDETPQFSDDYSQQNYDEETAMGVVLLTVLASDPDTNEELSFYLDDPEEYLQINETTGEISVFNQVDREEVESFIVNVTVQDLADHSSTVQIVVTVNDINDNAPILDSKICSDSYSVSEDADEGQSLVTLTATDDDVGIHADISYILQNINQPSSSIYRFAPFTIDEKTGEISVHITDTLILDRERRDFWQLSVYAADNCDLSDFKCKVNSDSCVLNVTIEDVNDNPPASFVSNIPLETEEFLLLGEDIPGLEISAFDPDEPNTVNSQINFVVNSMWNSDGDKVDLFEAINKQRTSPENVIAFYCNLRATNNLTGLRGDYTIEILGFDSGSPIENSLDNFTLTIHDSNDMRPQFSFSQCLEVNDNTITMQENITAINVPLNCSFLDEIGRSADIYITDLDQPNTPNSEVDLVIDYDNSEVVEGGADNQLRAFKIATYPSDKYRFGISTSEKIDREKGSAYNLSLIVGDRGEVPLSAPSWIYVIVKDFSEYNPTFCDQTTCHQTLTIKENSNETSKFTEAQDKDNSEFDENDIIYYSIIVAESDNAFYIPDPKINEIRPKIDLDRELTGAYEIKIMTSNSDADTPPDGIDKTNGVLSVSIIILDENDESPVFDEVVYGDFLNSGAKGNQIAILEFIDKDLNDTITYTFGSSFVWNEGQNYTDPFTINKIDDRRSEIILNMEPQGKYGYCSFIVIATDLAGHTTSAETEVFVVTDDYIVPFLFYDAIDDVDRNKDGITDIFTDVFNYTCIIDSIEKAKNSNNEPINGQTVVNAHFIDEINTREADYIELKSIPNNPKSKANNQEKTVIKNEILSQLRSNFKDNSLRNLVPESVKEENKVSNVERIKRDLKSLGKEAQYSLVTRNEIEEEGTNGEVTSELQDRLTFLGLDLVLIGDVDTSKKSDDEQKIINLKIALGTVALFLGLLVCLLLILYCVRITKLKRKFKAMSAQHVESRDSGFNNMGKNMGQVPGSNMYAKEATNPMWNMSEDDIKEATKDSESQRSGDSILVGVEDSAQFRESINQPKTNQSDDGEGNYGKLNFIFKPTISDEPLPSTSFQNEESAQTSKEMKQLDAIELEDQTNSERTSLASLDGSIDAQINSQFSFV